VELRPPESEERRLDDDDLRLICEIFLTRDVETMEWLLDRDILGGF
jgi:hypothetical protein